MDSRNIFLFFFFFIIVTFLCFATIEAQEDTPVYHIYTYCSTTNVTTSNSPFQLNLSNLLSSLSSNATGDTHFYNTTVTGSDSSDSDSVYGLFMCRGDVTSQVCRNCVANATQRLLSECSLSKQAVIWYDECMIRYSNRSFFSTVDTIPYVWTWKPSNVSNPVGFMRLLFSTMNETADKAAAHSSAKKFATMEATVSDVQTLYCLAQCTPDLSLHDCRTCLSVVIGDLPWCCDGRQGGRILYPSCNVRYELYPFYMSSLPSPTPAPALVPATSGSEADSNISQVPVYLSNNCNSSNNNEAIITADSSFKRSLTILLSYLSSNATGGKRKTFYMATVNMVHGHYMCRGDLPSRLCGQCVQNATNRITSVCHLQEAVIWYSHCLVRYSNQEFSSTVARSPMYLDINSSSSSTISDFYTSMVSNQLAQLANDTGDSGEKYMTKSLKLNHAQTLYSLGQCTPDLSGKDCAACLEDVIGTKIPWSRLGSVGGRVLYPSCNLRFELFQFYRDNDQDLPPIGLQGTPPPPDSQRQKSLSWVERYNIIGGISRGILYLHELSRLKVIHRDLKPSNILLDENMFPKISDFGLARIVEISQDQGSTNRIVGTYGYMSPEYAMLGQFSEKSDVFSFGVMILEIVTGKKNLSSYGHRGADGLLNYVWRQWRDQTPLSILDPHIKDDYSKAEVIKCIQIGLLCVQHNPDARPTMVTVVSYFSSYSVELPTPQEPAFFLRGRMDSNAAQGSSSTQSAGSSTLFSINEMPTSAFLPR